MEREVIVGNKPYKGAWTNFHGFLIDYLKALFKRWSDKELAKPAQERHPILI